MIQEGGVAADHLCETQVIVLQTLKQPKVRNYEQPKPLPKLIWGLNSFLQIAKCCV